MFKGERIHLINFCHFTKGDNFYDFLIAFLYTEPFGKTLKEENFISRETILSFLSRPLLKMEAKTGLAEMPPLQVFSFPLIALENENFS